MWGMWGMEMEQLTGETFQDGFNVWFIAPG